MFVYLNLHFGECMMKVKKWSESDIQPSMVTHTRNSCSTFTHPREHTHPELWAATYAAAPGEQLGVRCLAQVYLSRGIEGGESAVHSLHPPPPPHTHTHRQSLPDRYSNSQPFDSLTLGHNFPNHWVILQIHNHSFMWKLSKWTINDKGSKRNQAVI